jgi:DNA primase catalytic core
MNITNEMINEIRNKIDIVDVVSNYVPLTQRGKNYFGVCPFHDDNSPSMSVSKEKQIYKCFSCGATGNNLKFVMDYENISFMEALKILADRAGIPIAVDIRNIENSHSAFKNLYDIYEFSLKFFQNNLHTKEGINAKEYLYQRQIDDNIIKHFENNNNIVFLAYTKSIEYFLTVGYGKKDFPKNLVVRSSLWSDTENFLKELTFAFNIPLYTALKELPTNNRYISICDCINCGTCLKCYSNNYKNIVVKIH